MVKISTTKSTKVYRKLNDELIAKLCSFVAKGNYFSTSCHACGVSEEAFYEWMRDAEKDLSNGLDESNSLPVQLMKAIKKAEAECEARWVAQAEAHASKNVVSPLALLDRRFRARWGQTQQPIVGNTYNLNIEKAIIDAAGKFDAIMRRLAERSAKPLALPGGDEGTDPVTDTNADDNRV